MKIKKVFGKRLLALLSIVLLITGLYTGIGNAKYADAATSPYLNLKTLSLQNGKSTTLKLFGAKGKVSWSSSNKSVATVSSKGKVKAKKVGTTVVTAVNAKKSYKCNITVSNKNTKTLIVYYSWSGETKKAAAKIKKSINADMVRIQPRKAYSKDYDTTVDVAQKELKDNARPAVSTRILNMSQYDTVLVGYPIWWHTAPMTVGTFLEAFDWSGKTIYPVSQSASMDTSQYEESVAFIKACAKNAVVDAGIFTKSNTEITDYINNTVLK